MKNRFSQGLSSQIAISSIIISLFTIMAFNPELNSAGNGIINQNVNFYTPDSHVTLPVFSAGVECIYQTEPINTNLSKTSSSHQNAIPFFSGSSGFHSDYLHLNSFVCFSNSIPLKSSRQVCLLLDIPPPSPQIPA
jgi:hypothetical protein